MSGNKFKVWTLGGFKFRRVNYGFYFSDGSFSIGISKNAIKQTDIDNWLFEADLNVHEWMDREFYGQVFFDRFGKPVAIAIMTPYCFFKRCTWLYEYVNGDKWKWHKQEWEPTSENSTNFAAISFKKNNVHY